MKEETVGFMIDTMLVFRKVADAMHGNEGVELNAAEVQTLGRAISVLAKGPKPKESQ